MVDVKRVKLPGVGVLHTFVTEDGGKVGVVAHRSGPSDLITFEDVEAGSKSQKISLRLTDDESHTLAELLGGTQITESINSLEAIPGLSIDWYHVDYEDAVAGEPIGSLRDKGLVGVTVVAVVRGDSANPAPSVGFKVFPGDTLVLAGTAENVARAFHFFKTGGLELGPATGHIDLPETE